MVIYVDKKRTHCRTYPTWAAVAAWKRLIETTNINVHVHVTGCGCYWLWIKPGIVPSGGFSCECFGMLNTFILFKLFALALFTHTHTFNGPFSRTSWVSRYQKGKTNLDFTEARGGQWQWHQQGQMQVCTLLQTDNLASTPPLGFLRAGCPCCCPTNRVKALMALALFTSEIIRSLRLIS